MPLTAQVLMDEVQAYPVDTNAYISDLVFPRCALLKGTVDGNTGKVTGIGRRQARFSNIDLNSRRLRFTPGTRPQQIRATIEEFNLVVHRNVIDFKMDRVAWDALPDTVGPSTQANLIRPLANLLAVAREQTFNTAITTTANWADGYTGSAGNRWSDDNFNALEQVQDAISDFAGNAAGLVPNVMAFSVDAYYAFVNNPYIKQLYGLNYLDLNQGAVMERLEAALLGPFNNAGATPRRLRLVVSRATVNNANMAATPAPGFMLTDFAFMAYRPPTENLTTPVAHEELAAGKSYFWGGVGAKQFDDDTDMTLVNRAWEHVEPQAFDENLGYYFADIVG